MEESGVEKNKKNSLRRLACANVTQVTGFRGAAESCTLGIIGGRGWYKKKILKRYVFISVP